MWSMKNTENMGTEEKKEVDNLNFIQRNKKIIISVSVIFLLCLFAMFFWTHSAHPGDKSELMAVFIEFGALGLVLLMLGTIIDFIVSIDIWGGFKFSLVAKIASSISTAFIIFSLLSLVTAAVGYLYYKLF